MIAWQLSWEVEAIFQSQKGSHLSKPSNSIQRLKKMFVDVFTLWIILYLPCQTNAAAVVDAMITPAPFLPAHENLRRLAQERRLEIRAATTSNSTLDPENEMISYCYAEGGICDQELSIYRVCRASNGPSTQSIDFPKLEVCECQSGYWAADQALVYPTMHWRLVNFEC